jgi:hypothetical protein
MKRKTAQHILMAAGILALLGGGSCFLSLNPPVSGEARLGWGIIGGIAGVGALLLAVILGIVGLIGFVISRRDT